MDRPAARHLMALLVFAAMMLPFSGSAAQEPARLPAVVVRAAVENPGPRTAAGVVRDTFAIAIEGAEITIPSIQRRILSDTAGRFRLGSLRPGTYTIRARKIGYAPQTRSLVVDDSGGVATFELVPMAKTLVATVTSAARGGLSGTVGDTSYRAIIGATVRLPGSGQTTTTDSTGRFFIPLKAGKYYVVVERDGFADRMVSVTIPPDSGRHLTLLLPPRNGPRPVREAWNYADFGERMARVLPGHATIYNHDDLTRIGYEWVTEAVQHGSTLAGGKVSIQGGCYATLNGGPKAILIDDLTVDDVETLEVYPTGAPRRDLLAKRNKSARLGLPITNTGEADFLNGIHTSCPIIYVWTR